LFDEVPVLNSSPVGAEGAVTDQLGVKAAIVGVVDLLGHEAVEFGADFGDGLAGVDFENRRGCLTEGSSGGKGNCKGERVGGCFPHGLAGLLPAQKFRQGKYTFSQIHVKLAVARICNDALDPYFSSGTPSSLVSRPTGYSPTRFAA
jgi:hypothetical protein